MDNSRSVLEKFFAGLAEAPASLLLLDYDGTLAPFQRERMEARPYAGVVERLKRIQETAGSGFAMVSGRPTAEVAKLLKPLTGFAIRGAHGLEARDVDGNVERVALAEADTRALKTARSQLVDLGMMATIEEKAGGIALHWRAFAPDAAERLRALALRLWTPVLAGTSLRLMPFDGGLELRVTRPDKGDAVRAMLNEQPEGTVVAYLGDDATDEDAFEAVGKHGLSVLVREERRTSAAEVWLRPPEELLEFLDRWIEATSRNGAQQMRKASAMGWLPGKQM